MYIRYRSLERRHVNRDIIVMRYRLSIEPSRLSDVSKNGRRVLPQVFASVIETVGPRRETEGIEFSDDETTSIEQRPVMARGKVKCRVKRKKRNVANGAFTTSRRLHMRLLSTLERPSCELRCTRATLVSFPYHVRHFCGAHTPIFYSLAPSPLDTTNQPSP